MSAMGYDLLLDRPQWRHADCGPYQRLVKSGSRSPVSYREVREKYVPVYLPETLLKEKEHHIYPFQPLGVVKDRLVK